MGVHKIDNQAMLPSTSVYNDLGYITEDDEEDDELLVSTTPKKSSSSKGRRQSRGSYHKRDSLLSIDCTTVAVDDSIADDDDMNSPTHANISSSIKAKDTPHVIEDYDVHSITTNTNNNNNHTLLNIGNQVMVTKVNHKHYGMQGVIVKQTKCYSTVQLVEDDETIRIYHSSLALVDEDDDIEDEDDRQVDHSYQRDSSMAVISDCSDSEEEDDDDDDEEEEEKKKQDTSCAFGVEQVSPSSSVPTNSNIVNSMRQRNVELLHKVDVLEQSNSRYREEARVIRTEKEDLINRLKCPYCYEMKDEMYVMLPCGHRTCFDCHFMIGRKCPQGCSQVVQKVKLYH